VLITAHTEIDQGMSQTPDPWKVGLFHMPLSIIFNCEYSVWVVMMYVPLILVSNEGINLYILNRRCLRTEC